MLIIVHPCSGRNPLFLRSGDSLCQSSWPPQRSQRWRLLTVSRLIPLDESFSAPSTPQPPAGPLLVVEAAFHRGDSRCAPTGRSLRRPARSTSTDAGCTLPVRHGSRSALDLGGVPQPNFSRFATCSPSEKEARYLVRSRRDAGGSVFLWMLSIHPAPGEIAVRLLVAAGRHFWRLPGW